MISLLCVLLESQFIKVTHYESKKGIWEKLENNYEGDDKGKREKLQNYRRNFEILKMN